MYIVNKIFSETLLTGSNSNDTIINGGYDEIYGVLYPNSYSKVTIDAKGGNDSIFSDISGYFRTGSKNKIDGGSGDDTIDNDGNEATVTGGTGNDSIVNYGATVRIDAGDGNDTISNKGTSYDPVDHVTIIGGTGNDSIYNSGNTVSVDAGAGNDSITNGYNTNHEADKVTLNAGDGNDYIYNHNDGDVTTILGGSGNDTIENNGDSISIDAGDGDDSIFSYSTPGTIRGGAGNDKISLSSSGRNNLVDGGAGKDSIRNAGSNSTIIGGTGDDSIDNDGSNVLIEAGDGNDTINISSTSSKNITVLGGSGNDIFLNWGSDNRVDGGTGNDSIANSENSKNSSLIGGAGNDTVRETSKYGSTIDGGSGNDVVSLVSGSKNAFIVYHAGDGNDKIYGFKSDSTLSIAGGNYSAITSGKDVIFTVGDGKITLVGAATLDAINVNNKKIKFVDSSIDNSQLNVLLVGNDSANTIKNIAGGVTIRGGAGNDSIYNSTSSNYTINNGWGYVTIDGGDGNDTIYNNDPCVSIDGGAGNDSIFSYSLYGTIKGGAGNDTITLHGDEQNYLIKYQSGDGNDVIYGFQNSSTLSLAGTGYISTKSGNDVILTVTDGKISLIGAANLSKVNIVETPLNVTNQKSNISLIGTNTKDTITNTGSKVVVLAKGGNDYINNSGANVTVNAGAGNDTIAVNKAEGNLIQYQNGDGNDVITGFSEKSSLSIGGANYASVKYGDNVFFKVGDGIITIRGGADLAKLNVIGTADQTKTFNNTKDNALVIGNDLDNTISNSGDNVTIFANGGKDSIYNAWGADTITIEAGDGNDTIQSWGSIMTINAGNGNDYIGNHGGNNNKYDGGAGNDTIISEGNAFNSTLIGGAGNDYLRNDSGANVTMNGGKGNDTLKNGGSNAVFVYNLGDGDDVIEGFRADSTLDISGANYATEKSGSDVLVFIGDGSEVTLKGAASLSKVNVRGVEDKPKNSKNTEDNTSMVGSNYADTLENTGKNVTIMGNAGDDSIKSSGANSSIDGSRGNDKIENSGASSIVEGGAGNDSIYNNRGDKSLVEGGAGDDTINNRATSATILGGDGNDSIWNGDYGNRLVLDGGAGNDTIKNTGSDNLVNGGAGNDYIDNSDNGDNTNITINAGTGNDSINNDSQNILFQYKNGDGNDKITGFNATSTLSINGGVNDSSPLSSLGGTQATTTKSGNDLIVTVGDGKITLAGAANLSAVNIVETPLNYSSNKSNATVYGTNANDTITNTGEKVAIFARGGKDSILNNNKGVKSTLNGDAGEDYISNTAKNVTINAGGGKDEVHNQAANVSIVGGADNDSIFSKGSDVSIAGGEGNDTIENYTDSDKVLMDGGAGDDSIKNSGHNATIGGGAGNDTITNNSATAVSVVGADGNDVINVTGAYKNTISGDTGNDTINLDWNTNEALIQFKKGDGSDLITGFNSTDTLQIGGGSGTYSSAKSGDDVIVTVDIDEITLAGAATLTNVNIDGRTKLGLHNSKSNVSILGSELNDSVINTGFEVTINSYGGNDTIKNYTREVTVDAGTSDDFIENKNTNLTTIDAGDGNDAIVSKGGYRNTIHAGKGLDSIDISNGEEILIQYRVGDGNDYIVGFNETSSLSLAGDVFSTSKSNQNVIVKIGRERITLEGAASVSPLNIIGVEEVQADLMNMVNDTLLVGTAFDDAIRNAGNNVTIIARGGNDSIHNGYWNEECGNVTIDAGAGNDTIINENSSTVSIDAGEGNDYVENRNEYLTIRAGDGDDTIFNNYGGINSTVDGGAGNDSIDNRASNATISGGTGDDTIYNNWDVKNGVALSDDNADGENVVFNYKTGDGNDVIYGFQNSSTLLIDDGNGAFASTKSGSDIIVTNSDGSEITLKSAANLRKVDIIGKELKGAIAVENTLSNSQSNVLIIGNGSANIVDNRGNNVTILANGGNDSIDNSGSQVTIDGGDGNDYIHNDNNSDNVTINGNGGNDKIGNRGNNVVVNGGAGDDTITSVQSRRNNTIDGGTGNDVIESYGKNSTITGGTGNDTINLSWDSDRTLIQYNEGDDNDVINGFKTDSTLRIGDGSGTYSTTKSGSDIIVTVGDGKITLTGAANLSKVNIAGVERIIVESSLSNSQSNVTITGNDSANTVNNSGANVLINGNSGNDSISNTGDSVTITGGSGNDTLWNEVSGTPAGGKKVSLSGGAGADFIASDGENSTLIGDADNDTIQNWGANSTIDGGKGNDSITNSGSNVSIDGGKGDDDIYNSGNYATIDGGKGNDSITNYGSNVSINGGKGNDSILSHSYNFTINGGTGDDTIALSSTGNDNLIIYNAGDGNDVIDGFNTTSTLRIGDGTGTYSTTKSGSDIIVTVGDGKITLSGAATLSTVNIAGELESIAVDDTIDNDISDISIAGDDSANTIKNSGANVTILANGGNDSISNSGANATINGGTGNDFILNDGSYATIDGGAGDDHINNNEESARVNGGDGNDSIFNDWRGSNVTVDGGAGNDSISNDSDNVTLAGGAGNDTIENDGAFVNIQSGADDDCITNFGSEVTIEAGAGDDSILSHSYNFTINGGTGDDTIALSSTGNDNLIIYNAGDGNDVITGFNETSTLRIGDGTGTYSTTKSGSDIIVTVGDGAITLSGAATLSNVNIAGEAPASVAKNISNTQSNVTIIGSEGNDTIRNRAGGVTIDGGKGNDSIGNYRNGANSMILGGEGKDSIANGQAQNTLDGGADDDYIYNDGNNVTIKAGAGNDTIQNNGLAGYGENILFEYNAGDGNDSIEGFKTNSTLRIGDGSGTYSTTKSGNDIVVTVGEDKITLAGAANLSTVNIAGKLEPIAVEDSIDNGLSDISIAGNDSANTIKNSGANVSINGNGGNDSISNTGDSVTIAGGDGNDTLWNEVSGAPAGGKKVSLSGGAGADFLASDGENSTLIGDADNDTIQNWGANSSIDGGAGDDSISNTGANVTIAGGEGNDSISNTGANVTINGGAGNDDIYNTGNTVSVDAGAGNDTIRNGYNTNSQKDNVTLNAGDGNDYIYNHGSGDYTTILGGKGDDTIENNGDTVSIDGGDGDDSIFSYSFNGTINGGAGDDTITMTSDSKNNMIVYNAGDGEDYISGFKTDSTLEIGGGSGTYFFEKSGNDIVVTVGEDKITLSGAATLSTVNIAGKLEPIAVEDSIDNDLSGVSIAGNDSANTIKNSGANVTIIGNGGNDSISNTGANVTINGGAGNDDIYNTGNTVSVDAGAGNDTIRNGYNTNSQKDNVTLNAGDGNDYIYNHGSGDYTTILGGNGDDTIENNGDTVSIDGGDGDDSIFSYSYNGTINGGTGDDTITMTSNSTNNVIVYNAGDGEDYISGFKTDSTLEIGGGSGTYFSQISGSDIIITVGDEEITLAGAANLSKVNISGEAEPLRVDDTIDNDLSGVSIVGNDSANTIKNSGNNVTINGNGGNDSISNSGANATINGGAGDDTITLSSDSKNNLIVYRKGDGNDVIKGFKTDSTLTIASGGYISEKSGSDIIVTVKNDKITLSGAANLSKVNIAGAKYAPLSLSNREDNVSLVGSQSDDTIENYGANVTILANDDDDLITNKALNTSILGGEGNDTVVNAGSNITVDSGAGDDSIDNYSKFSTIDAGDGSDTIENSPYANNVSITGGAGNDSISDWGLNSTMSGGKGDDTISLSATNENALIQYASGDGNDLITGFKANSTLSISGGKYELERTDADIIITVGDEKITLAGASTLSAPNIIGEPAKSNQYIENEQNGVVITGTALNDTIANTGKNVTIQALEGDDSIKNYRNANNVVIDAGAGNDTVDNQHIEHVTITAGDGNDYVYTNANYNSISAGAGNDTVYSFWSYFSTLYGGEGNDSIYTNGESETINGGEGNDTITLDGTDSILVTYDIGDGDDLIQGFDETSTLSLGTDHFDLIINGDDVIVSVEEGNITLEGAAEVDPLNIVTTQIQDGTYVIFTVKGSAVTYETDIPESIIRRSYKFDAATPLLKLNDRLKKYFVTVKNEEEDTVKVNWHCGSASLSSASVLEYRLSGQENNVTLTSTNYNDEIAFSEDVALTYGEIKAALLSGSALSTKSDKAISFKDDSSGSITAPEGSQIGIGAGKFTVNDLPINSTSGAGTISVESDGLKFEGYGVQFIDLEIAKENYYENVTPMVAIYNLSDKSYTIQNTAVVKTLANEFTKLTFDFSIKDNNDYAFYKVNGKTFLVASDADNINVIEAKDSKFKIQGKEVGLEKVSSVKLDDKITFTGMEINFDDVQVNYAQDKATSYSLDGKEVAISAAATVATGADTKTFTCAASSYVVNGRSFETSADLTFTADTSAIKIPLSNAATEIYFDGVTVSGVSDGGDLVFNLAEDKIIVPNGAIINVSSSEEVKLTLEAGSFTVNDNKISSGVEIEIAADKDNIKVPLSENPVTINDAIITGTHDATIDNNKMIILSDGALVANTSENLFALTEKNSAASFGNANKKVLLTDDETAYIKFEKSNTISIGLNPAIFENIDIYGVDAWTVETSGKNGADKVAGIMSGATISASATDSTVDLYFEVETEGNGEFTICDQKFISTGDAENIFTVSKLPADTSSDNLIAVTAITKKLGTVDGNFETGIEVNPLGDGNEYTVKATNNSKDIEVAMDAEGKMSVEKIEDGANVESYGQAEKVITVKNNGEYSLQIADYKYMVNGDLDEDGITFELVDGDFKVRTLYEDGLVTRYNVNDEEQEIWTWSIEQDKWIREQIIEDAPYEITINADKTLTLKANGILVNPYSTQVIASPKSGAAVEDDITITAKAIDGVTTFINNSDITPNVLVEDESPKEIMLDLASGAEVKVDKRKFTLQSESAAGTTFKLNETRAMLKIANNFSVEYVYSGAEKTDVTLDDAENNLTLSNTAAVTAPVGKTIKIGSDSFYTVNKVNFTAEKDSIVRSITNEIGTQGVEFDLTSGQFLYDDLKLSGSGTARIVNSNLDLVRLSDGACVDKNRSEFSYYNRRFLFNGSVEIAGKKFETDKEVRGGLIYFQTSYATYNDDGTYEEKTLITSGFVVESQYVNIQNSFYESAKIVDGKVSSVEGVRSFANISGNGTADISIVTKGNGTFTIGGKVYKISGDSDGVTFVTDSTGNVAEINDLQGAVEGNFENAISVNGKAIRLTGASTIKVASDGENVTEITDVAGDLVTSDGNSYRKEIVVYNSGGAEKLTTTANGTIIFNGQKFETSAGKTFTLDDSGNVSGLEKAQSDTKVLAAYTTNFDTVEENFGTINLSTTDGLEEVIGDFSEGLTVNGVFVRVTDSTNFIVKDDDETVYIETTAADTFTINGKTFKTEADKTIFKLDENGDVCEIVTDSFLPGDEYYLVEGDFSEEIIFEGKKFCVTGTNYVSIFIGNSTLLSVKLARNAVEVVESGGADDIIVEGQGEITVGDKTFSTSEGFVGYLQANADGNVYSIEYLLGTLSGKLGGIDFTGLKIDSEDNFSVTSSGGEITAIENLQNGSFTCDDLDGMTINGAKVNFNHSEELKVEVSDGDLKISELANGAFVSNSGGKVTFVTKESGEFSIGEDDFKVTGDDSVTFVTDADGKVQEISDLDKGASVQTTFGGEFIVNGKTLTAKDNGVIVGTEDSAKISGAKASAEEILEIFTGDAKKVVAANGRATIKNYNYKGGEGFKADYTDAEFRNGELVLDSATITFADGADTQLVNFFNADGDKQKVGFASDDALLDAGKESGHLIIYGGSNSTLRGGTGRNEIYLEENSGATIALNGRNTIHNFNATFDYGDRISIGANANFKFDGESLTIKSGAARGLIESVSADDGTARILTVDNGNQFKTAVAQKNSIIASGDELADVYYGNKSGVDFTGYGEPLTADLRENFNGINRVTVGGGLNTVISSSRNETLSGNADGTTEFIFDKGNGRDLIQNFNFDGDKINVGTNAVTDVKINSAGAVRMQIGGGDDWITLDDAQGKTFKINDYVAKVDKNIEYDEAANYFVATSRNATLTVTEEAEIWLDGSHGKIFAGDIKTLDASTAEGKTSLVGNDLDNTILAGTGDASLWGGTGGDDLLVGGASKNTFFYALGNGNDTISGANDGDLVYLSGVMIEQISGTNITADGVAISFADGGSLQINSSANVTYQLADGAKFSADHEQAIWLTK